MTLSLFTPAYNSAYLLPKLIKIFEKKPFKYICGYS